MALPRSRANMLRSLLSLLGSRLSALRVCHCMLAALNLGKSVPVPSPPRVVPILTLPPDDEEDDKPCWIGDNEERGYVSFGYFDHWVLNMEIRYLEAPDAH